ncbi:MAG: tetratricopeptide repeat protein [Rhodocyclaceae bacterium]|nr:tetratricopeptide repeat protein [Rhodocyclaceae bacterium]
MQEIPGADVALIEAWIAKGRFERALKPLEALALDNPTSARVWKNLGVVHQKLGHHDQAEKHLAHAIELDGSDVDAHCSLGGVYLSQGKLDEATASFERGLELSANGSTFALLNYLAIRARTGTLDAALPRFAAALEAGARSCRQDIDAGRNLPWACFDLAQFHLLRGERVASSAAITEAVRLANASWQLDSATAIYRLMAESPEAATRAGAVEILALIDTLKQEYFAEPDHKRCFVMMPFGKKLDASGREVDFDEVYETFIKPTIESEGLESIRCDEVDEAGNIHNRMFQLIWRAEVAIADVSIPNPNVFYELGIRHALHKAVTVIIRNRNAKLPFNIANLNAIEYDFDRGAHDEEARRRIRRAVSVGLRDGQSDSHVSETLDLRISDRPRVIGSCDIYSYPIRGSHRKLALITGDLRNVRGIDVWVNSENTNMQMARYYDFAISSMIRYEGARKTRTGHVAEDLIQKELDEIMAGERSVPEGTVIATGPGELSRYGVRAVFHAASVRGAIGYGYEPVRDIHRCVTNALALIDDPASNVAGSGLASILIPLLGIGFTRGDFRPVLNRQIEAALEYLAGHPESSVDSVYFLAWSEQELALCQSVLRSFDVLDAPVRAH